MTFKNCSLLDFTVPTVIQTFKDTLQEVYESLANNPPRIFPYVAGQRLETQEQHTSVDPSTEQTIASIYYANSTHGNNAIEQLHTYAQEWRLAGQEARSACIRKAATTMEERRYELAATLVIEVGKPWAEADADIAEAIDFCRYYATQMDTLAQPKKTMEVVAEHSFYQYRARGVAVVIAPWNFPCAIACGMTVAALVSGNVVALKPAEQSSLIAYRLYEILLQAGVPSEALAFLPGAGEVLGEALVVHPKTDLIAFTGSRAVGLHILEAAAVVRPGQRVIKKVLAELGGKNTIIIDEDADLDQAIKGVLYSTFGFAGQKCSACSRVLVVKDAYETFTTRLRRAVSDLLYGSAHDPSVFYGPVVDKHTQTRLRTAIEKAQSEFTCLHVGEDAQCGFIVPPALFADVPLDSWLWNEEQFGPILALHATESIEEAVRIANDSDYGLTGALYSRSPKNIAFVTEHLAVGNFYVNRGCTGAIVCRHPFGGLKLSGVGSKAGGPDYLLQFLEPRTVTENTMRSGFTPDLTT